MAGVGQTEYIFCESTSGINVNLTTGIGTGGSAEGDTYVGISDVTATSYDDVITGTSWNNALHGRNGNDTLNGEAGDDLLLGGYGDDILNGGDGDDRLLGDYGADQLNGGAGIDSAYYYHADTAITVNLAANSASGGVATCDTFTDIENIWGSFYDDILTGDSGDNRITGSGGDDIIDGGAGTDYAHYNF